MYIYIYMYVCAYAYTWRPRIGGGSFGTLDTHLSRDPGCRVKDVAWSLLGGYPCRVVASNADTCSHPDRPVCTCVHIYI